jgi:hypothetical protein
LKNRLKNEQMDGLMNREMDRLIERKRECGQMNGRMDRKTK